MTAFEEFGVLPELGKAIDEMDWTLPTDVQAEAIPLILGGGDVLMAAETGSGKTGAFCLPILQIVWETLKDFQEGKTSKIVQQVSTEWTMSFFDRTDALAVTPDGLRCQSRDPQGWHGCRATKGVHTKGAYYYEATVTDEGLCRVGWSTQAARLDLGTDRLGFGFGGTGKKSNAKQFDDYGSAYGKNDVIGCLLNLTAGEIRFTKNGEDLGVAFKLDQSRRSDCYFPAVVLKNAEISFNFGTTPFKHSPPSGYLTICQAPKENVKINVVSATASTENKQVNNAPQAIIIEPSRELAEQTYNQITKLKKHLEDPAVRELLVVGGVNVKEQINQLNAGVDIVVGTPGRLEDLIQGGYLSLTHCRFFVLDEADGLLKAGYSEMIDRLHRQIPKITSDGRRLQMVVCSATLHAFEVKKMAEKLMHFPTWVDLKGEDAVPETVHHVVVLVDPQRDRAWETSRKQVQTDGVHAKDNIRSGNTTPETLSEAVKILKGEYCIKAIREHKMDRAIIFCRTKLDCDNMERYFKSFGSEFSCVCLHGDRKPQERKGNLEKFKQSQVRFLICTDVAARGIDIGGLPFMINVTLPDEKSNYVHRIGRVGRAERMGLAISLVSSVPEKVWYHGEWCSTRGRNCWNTNLTDDRPKGCCVWYNEPQYLADIEEHLNITIQQVEPDMKVPCNEFDGKVVYGQKRKQLGSGYQDHVSQMAPVVRSLQELESQAQLYYLKMHHNTDRSSPVSALECVKATEDQAGVAEAPSSANATDQDGSTAVSIATGQILAANPTESKEQLSAVPNNNVEKKRIEKQLRKLGDQTEYSAVVDGIAREGGSSVTPVFRACGLGCEGGNTITIVNNSGRLGCVGGSIVTPIKQTEKPFKRLSGAARKRRRKALKLEADGTSAVNIVEQPGALKLLNTPEPLADSKSVENKIPTLASLTMDSPESYRVSGLGCKSGNIVTTANLVGGFGCKGGNTVTPVNRAGGLGCEGSNGNTVTTDNQAGGLGFESGNTVTFANRAGGLGCEGGNPVTTVNWAGGFGYESGNTVISANRASGLGCVGGNTVIPANRACGLGCEDGNTVTPVNRAGGLGCGGGNTVTTAKKSRKRRRKARRLEADRTSAVNLVEQPGALRLHNTPQLCTDSTTAHNKTLTLTSLIMECLGPQSIKGKGHGKQSQQATDQKYALNTCKPPLFTGTPVTLHADGTQQVKLKRDPSPDPISSKRLCLEKRSVTNSQLSEGKADVTTQAHLRVVIMNQIRDMTPAETITVRKALEGKIYELFENPDYTGRPPLFADSPRRLAGGLRLYCNDDWSLQWLNSAVGSLGKLWNDCGDFYTIPMCQLSQYVKGVIFIPDFPGDITALRNGLAKDNRFFDVKHWPLFTHRTLHNGAVTNHLLVFGIPPADAEKLRYRGSRLIHNLVTVNVALKGRLGDRKIEKESSEVASDGSGREARVSSHAPISHCPGSDFDQVNPSRSALP